MYHYCVLFTRNGDIPQDMRPFLRQSWQPLGDEGQQSRKGKAEERRRQMTKKLNLLQGKEKRTKTSSRTGGTKTTLPNRSGGVHLEPRRHVWGIKRTRRQRAKTKQRSTAKKDKAILKKASDGAGGTKTTLTNRCGGVHLEPKYFGDKKDQTTEQNGKSATHGNETEGQNATKEL